MDVSNGLACRYCGKKWFAHDIVPHEKNCRLKIVKMIDTLFDQYRICLKYPPENVLWPLPPKVPKDAYNAHAFKEYQNSWQLCQKCGRSYPPIALADHFAECSGEGKVLKSRQAPRSGEVRPTIKRGQTVMQPGTRMETLESIGIPVASSAQPRNPPRGLGKAGAYDDVYPYMQASGPIYHVEFAVPEQANVADDRVECPRCGRKFAQNRIGAHEKICTKLKHGPPPGPDEFYRKEKTDAEWARTTLAPGEYAYSAQQGRQPAKKVYPSASKKAADPFYSAAMSDGRIQCRMCGRGFARERIEKHEQICKGLENFAIKAPPKVYTDKTPQKSITKAPVVTRQQPAVQYRTPISAGSSQVSTKAAERPPTSGKFCTECGSMFGSSAKFCAECGARRM